MVQPVDMDGFRKAKGLPSATPPTLKDGGGDGTSGEMEARVAKLEAHMEHVRAELGKLAGVPSDVATIKERTSHMPTKADVKGEIVTAVDRAGAKVQRNVAVIAGVAGLLVTAANYLPKILGH